TRSVVWLHVTSPEVQRCQDSLGTRARWSGMRSHEPGLLPGFLEDAESAEGSQFAVPEIGGRSHSDCSLEVVHQMALVVVPDGESELRPVRIAPSQTKNGAKT